MDLLKCRSFLASTVNQSEKFIGVGKIIPQYFCRFLKRQKGGLSV